MVLLAEIARPSRGHRPASQAFTVEFPRFPSVQVVASKSRLEEDMRSATPVYPRYRSLSAVLILGLSCLSWSQSSTPNTSSVPAQAAGANQQGAPAAGTAQQPVEEQPSA